MDFKEKGFSSKSEMRRIEHQKESDHITCRSQTDVFKLLEYGVGYKRANAMLDNFTEEARKGYVLLKDVLEVIEDRECTYCDAPIVYESDLLEQIKALSSTYETQSSLSTKKEEIRDTNKIVDIDNDGLDGF